MTRTARMLVARFGAAIEGDEEINGGDAVDFLSEIYPLVKEEAGLTPAQALARLRDAGLTFDDCVEAFANAKTSAEVERGRDLVEHDPDLEVPEKSVIVDNDRGTFVLAWLRVS